MLVKATLLLAATLASSFVAAVPADSAIITTKPDKNCAKYEILFTGLPPYHPDVLAQGYNGDQVAAGLKAQLVELVNTGYNTKELFWGPEEGTEPLEKAIKGKKWDGIVVGFGVRGDGRLGPTIHFEEIMNLLRVKAPKSTMIFNYNPTSTLEAVQRNFPLNNCSGKPGKNYGEEIICSVCAQ